MDKLQEISKSRAHSACIAVVMLLAAYVHADEPGLHIEPRQRLIFEDVSIRITGAAPGGRVIIEATLEDDGGQVWSSRGIYYANLNGQVEVSTSASLAGTYDGVNAEGLFWSMLPFSLDQLPENGTVDIDRTTWPSFPNFRSRNAVDIEFSATIEIGETADETRTARMRHRVDFASPGVTREEVSQDELRGVMYKPSGSSPYPVVIVISGSGGGTADASAALLASHGIASFALAHFNYKDRPDELVNIPLEYFRSAIDWARDEFHVEKVGLVGASRGGEGVLLIASTFPELVSAVVAEVPSNVVVSGCCSAKAMSSATWTYGGETVGSPIMPGNYPYKEGVRFDTRRFFLGPMAASDDLDPAAILVENIQSPILLISAGADELWPSSIASEKVVERLNRHSFKYPVKHLMYSGAGHSAAAVVLVTSLSDSVFHRLTKSETRLGGLPAQNAYASKDAFARKVSFLKTHIPVDDH